MWTNKGEDEVQFICGLPVNSRVATYVTMLEVRFSVYHVLVFPWNDLRMDAIFINL
jgi:hypothetical protein